MIAWILLGIIAGAIAKFIMPGKDPGGLFITMMIGIGGSFMGGFIGKLLPFLPDNDPGEWLPSFGSVVTATVGAVVLLLLYRKFKK